MTDYSFDLPVQAGLPEITVTPAGDNVSVTVEKPEAIPGDVKIHAVSSNGYERTYTIHLSAASEYWLSDIGYDASRSSSGYNGIHVNKNNADNPIRLKVNGKSTNFEKGFGVNSDSWLYFDVSGMKIDRLQGYAGIDLEKNKTQDGCYAAILVDGVEKARSNLLKHNEEAFYFDVDVRGAHEICLYVDKNVKNGHDMLSWGDMKLTRLEEDVPVTESFRLKEDSTLKIDRAEGILYNVAAGSTLAAIREQIAIPEGYTVTMAEAMGGDQSDDSPAGTGYLLRLEKDGAIEDSLKIAVRGDIDGSADSRVSELDVKKLDEILAGAEYDALTLRAADLNEDGVLDKADRKLMLQLAGMPDEDVKVASITLSGVPETLNPGDSFTLQAEILPADAEEKGLTFTSNAPQTAVVDADGKVRILGQGTAVITASSTDGSNVSASVTVATEKAGETVSVWMLSGQGVEGALEKGDGYDVLLFEENPASGWGGVHINKADTGANASTTPISMKVDGAQVTFDYGLSANAPAQITYDLSSLPAGTKTLRTWIGIDYIKAGKTGRDGASFAFYKDSVEEVNKLYDAGTIMQNGNAVYVELDVTDVQTLIFTAGENGSKNDDCVDWAMPQIVVEAAAERADTTLLQMGVSYADVLKESGALEGVNEIAAANFDKALAQARALLENPAASQQAVNDAWKTLSQAIHMLSFKTDKTALLALIAQAEQIDLDAMQEEGKEEFAAALAQAKETAADPAALTEQSIAAAIARLQAAMDALAPIENDLDTSLLAWLIEQVKDTDLNLYLSDGKDAFESALAQAQSVLAAPESQQQIDDALSSLSQAWLNLRLKADESLLESLRTRVDALEALGGAAYASIAESRAQLLREAGALLAAPEAAAADVQQAIDAIDGLLAKAGVSAPADSAKPAQPSASVKTSAATGFKTAGFSALAAAAAALLFRKKRK